MARTTHTFDSENIKYLEGLLGKDKVDTYFRLNQMTDGVQSDEDKKTCETVHTCLTKMQEFGNNRWWASDDKRVIGYYQLMYPCLLVPFSKFHEALEFLLGRPVWTHELGLNWEGLKAEAERDFNGTQDTEEQKAESIKASFQQLADLGKPVIGVVI